jgi:hypothetical protein
MLFLPLVSEVNLTRCTAVDAYPGWGASEEALGQLSYRASRGSLPDRAVRRTKARQLACSHAFARRALPPRKMPHQPSGRTQIQIGRQLL